MWRGTFYLFEKIAFLSDGSVRNKNKCEIKCVRFQSLLIAQLCAWAHSIEHASVSQNHRKTHISSLVLLAGFYHSIAPRAYVHRILYYYLRIPFYLLNSFTFLYIIFISFVNLPRIILCRNGSVTLHIIIIKNAGLRSMRVKYKEENSL